MSTIINKDWKQYVLTMPHKECVFIDPPWNYTDMIDRPGYDSINQLGYSKWNNKEDLDFLFKNIKCDYLFIWTTNNMLEDVFKSNHYNFKFKNIITWIKKTKNGLIHYGLGFYFRNSTEQVLLFINKGVKPLRWKDRNIFEGQKGDRTKKPKSWEKEILSRFNNSAYIFCGPFIDELLPLNIELIDTCL